jgi:hypothetical protein
MEENTSSAQPQAGEAENPQPQAGATPEPQAGDGQSETTISLEEAKKLRSEAANLRKRLKGFEEAETKAKEAQLSEQQKLEKKLADLQAQHDAVARQSQERIVNYEVRLQAAQMGIVDPDAAARLLDWSGIEYDDDGSPQNVSELLKGLLKAKPYLAGKQAPTSGGATNPSRSQSSGAQSLSWEVIGQMKPEEYAARSSEIKQWIAAHPYKYGSQRH